MRTKYPISWARGVVEHAMEKHARVSDMFKDFTGLSVNQLAIILATDRPEWPILRDMLKQLDQWQLKQLAVRPGHPLESTTLLFSCLLRTFRGRMPEKMLLYLESREKEAIIEEQANGGGPP